VSWPATFVVSIGHAAWTLLCVVTCIVWIIAAGVIAWTALFVVLYALLAIAESLP
jgi:hypothetical protein